jgi:DNA-binding MurR/RpiR family transcriptional regulator
MLNKSEAADLHGSPLPVRVQHLSRKRREIVRPLLQNPREFVLLSVRDIARKLKTNPATVVRIVQRMGFASYKEFQHHLHELSVAHATSLDLMRSASPNGVPAPVQSLNQDLKNIHALHNSLDVSRLQAFVKRIWSARRVALIGGDLAAHLVGYFEYQLTILGLPVLTATTPGRTAHLVRSFRKGDLVIAISFRRGLRQTVEGMKQARENGAYCVGLTDTYISPIARFADEFFLVSVETKSFGASYIAPMALVNVVLALCANYRRDRTLKLLKQVDIEQRQSYRWYE